MAILLRYDGRLTRLLKRLETDIVTGRERWREREKGKEKEERVERFCERRKGGEREFKRWMLLDRNTYAATPVWREPSLGRHILQGSSRMSTRRTGVLRT